LGNKKKRKVRSDVYPKKDTGIATLKNGLRISEETRDDLQRHHWQGPRRDQSKDPENWTTQECKDNKLSGFRANMLVRQMEVWVLGHIERTIPLDKCTPDVMAAIHEQVFATNGTLAEISVTAPVAEKREW
jgi:hypothetical protein